MTASTFFHLYHSSSARGQAIDCPVNPLKVLQEREGQPFSRTMRSVPDDSGIYMLSDAQDASPCYYIGMSKGIRSSISYFSDGSSAGSGMIGDLIAKGHIASRKDAKDWMRSHVMVRWLETDEHLTSDSHLHRFLIAILQPAYNEDR